MEKVRYFLKKYANTWTEYIFVNGFWGIIKNIPSPLGMAIRSVFLRFIGSITGFVCCETGVDIRNFSNVRIGNGSFIESHAEINGLNGLVNIGKNAYIGRGSIINCYNFKNRPGSSIKIGDNFYCGEFVNVRGQGPIEIGNDVLLSPYVGIFPVNHQIKTGSSAPRNIQPITALGIKISNNVWIGASATILDGVIIGENSIISSGSVVKGKIASDSLYGGVPAKFIKTISED